MITKLKPYQFRSSEYKGEDNAEISREVGVAMCTALQAYDSGNFAQAVDLLLPLRYSLVTIGGSNAQVGPEPSIDKWLWVGPEPTRLWVGPEPGL